MASYMEPRTRAVSFKDSFLFIWDPVGPRYVVCAPWSAAPTSKAHRVLVESFSKMSTKFLPSIVLISVPAFLSAFNLAAKSK